MTRRQVALTPEKRRLISQLVERRRSGVEASRVIPKADRSRPLPLSFGQERLWFLEQLAPGNPYYNDCEAFRLKGPLDVGALRRALNRIVERHEILRTCFPTEDGRPRQAVAPELTVELPLTDLSDLAPERKRAQTAALAGRDLDEPFALDRLPLHRFQLVRHAEDEHVLLFTLHHIIFDGWSLGVFVRELGALYESEITGGPADLPELAVQYADFANWQRQRMDGEELERQLAYWQARFRGAVPRLELPTDRPRSAAPSYRGGLYPVELGPDLSQAVRQLGAREGTTQFVVLLAAYETLLFALTGETDLVVGTPISNRNHSETELLLGFLLNTLALRTDASGDPTLMEFLHRVAQTNTGAAENQELPFERLVAELNPERQVNRNPLFQVWFTLLSAPMPELELHGLTLQFAEIETRTARFDLALIMWDDGGQLRGHFEYSEDLFHRATVADFARRYRTVLEHAVQRPDARLSEIVALLEGKARAAADETKQRRRRAGADRLSELRGRGDRKAPRSP